MSLHRTLACLLTTAVLAGAGWVCAQTAPTEWHAPMLLPGNRPTADNNRPRWVEEPLAPTSGAHITRMVEGRADVVVLNGGYYQGFRNGVICNVEHGGTPVARLIVVSAEENRSAALITDLPKNVILVPGDNVRLSAL